MKFAHAFAFVAALLLLACSSSNINTELDDAHYQPIGTAVLTANGFLIAAYPDGLTEPVDIAEYKRSLLEEGYQELYQALLPMSISIQPRGKHFIVKVLEDGAPVLYDVSCTESRLDCWLYRGQCSPDTLVVPCLESQ